MSAMPRTVEWIGGVDGFLRMIDQTRLPSELVFRDCRTVEEVWEAIRMLRVRGAPVLGVAAAYGAVIGMHSGNKPFAERRHEVIEYLRTSRPTAVNLFWALDKIGHCDTVEAMFETARQIEADDQAMCCAIGEAGAELVPDGGGVLTHCNAGRLVCTGVGTALAPLYLAAQQGKQFRVFADETRPLLQGARLTAWELQQHGIDVTVICDNMAGEVMREGRIQMVIVGADRIAANGDTANKIGTYTVAVLAHVHGIPFYVAAPSSTFDLSLPSGEKIPIEQRDLLEVTHGFGRVTAPTDVNVYNPAFDVTPARLITAFVTERGVIRPAADGQFRFC